MTVINSNDNVLKRLCHADLPLQIPQLLQPVAYLLQSPGLGEMNEGFRPSLLSNHPLLDGNIIKNNEKHRDTEHQFPKRSLPTIHHCQKLPIERTSPTRARCRTFKGLNI